MNIVFSPSWFFGYGIVLQIVFMIASFAVCLFAYKVYKSTQQQGVKLLSTAFLFVCLSYVVQIIFNLMIVFKVRSTPHFDYSLRAINNLYLLGEYSSMLFMITGFVVLLYMVLKLCNAIAFWLMLLIAIVGLTLSRHIFLTFFVYEVIFLGVLAYYFYKNYQRRKVRPALLVFSGFGLWLLGSVSFLFSVYNPWFYVFGHILTFLGYMCILANLVMVRHYEKTKST